MPRVNSRVAVSCLVAQSGQQPVEVLAARAACPAPEPERRHPDNVGSARLTCGQPASRSPSAQVSPKREVLSADLQARSLSLRVAMIANSSPWTEWLGPRSSIPDRPPGAAGHAG
jgi:hypothetical protein